MRTLCKGKAVMLFLTVSFLSIISLSLGCNEREKISIPDRCFSTKITKQSVFIPYNPFEYSKWSHFYFYNMSCAVNVLNDGTIDGTPFKSYLNNIDCEIVYSFTEFVSNKPFLEHVLTKSMYSGRSPSNCNQYVALLVKRDSNSSTHDKALYISWINDRGVYRKADSAHYSILYDDRIGNGTVWLETNASEEDMRQLFPKYKGSISTIAVDEITWVKNSKDRPRTNEEKKRRVFNPFYDGFSILKGDLN